ncbi:MAG: hypothetical protein ACREUU_08280 [Gammaproteobacteria bacterium]
MAAFSCPHCGVSIKENPTLAGRRVRCPKCQQPFDLPAARSPALLPTSVHPPAATPPITPHPVPSAQPTVVLVGSQQPRMDAGGWFARAFTTTSGIVVAVLLFGLVIVGLPIAVVCGGCFMLANQVGEQIEKERIANSPRPVVPSGATDASDPSAVSPIETADSSEPTAPVVQWHPHDQPLAVADVVVRIVEVNLNRVPLTNLGRESASEDPLLWLRVRVENQSSTKKIEFARWNTVTAFNEIATLEDDLGNHYKRVNFGFGSRVAGLEHRDSIYPGKSADAVLVFEVPIDAAKTLRLKMPAEAVGGQGEFRFEIPVTAVRR